jgi:predicted Zn-dependent protease
MSYFVRNHRDAEQLFMQMRALHATGQLFEVQLLAQCIIDQYNDNIQNVDFFILAAQVEFELYGFTEKADQLLRQALKIAPFNDLALAFFKMTRACVDLQDGLYEKGETKLRECLNTVPLRAYASFLLGHHLFWKTSETQEAIALLEAVVFERTAYLAAWTDLALAYKRVGDRFKANHALNRCLKIDREPARRAFYERHIERQ